MKLHLDVKIKSVFRPHHNAQLDYLVQYQIKSFVQIILALITCYNVKFQMFVIAESYAQIKLADLICKCALDKSLVKVDILYVKIKIASNLV